MEKHLEIKLPNCTIHLTVTEMMQLLYSDPELWEKALIRSKAFKRAGTQRQREQKKYRDHYTKDPGFTGQWGSDK